MFSLKYSDANFGWEQAYHKVEATPVPDVTILTEDVAHGIEQLRQLLTVNAFIHFLSNYCSSNKIKRMSSSSGVHHMTNYVCVKRRKTQRKKILPQEVVNTT